VLLPSLLCAAAAQGDLYVTKQILGIGVSPADENYDGETALHEACRHGHTELAAYLLQVGAPIAPVNRWNQTPLVSAVSAVHAHCCISVTRLPCTGDVLNLIRSWQRVTVTSSACAGCWPEARR